MNCLKFWTSKVKINGGKVNYLYVHDIVMLIVSPYHLIKAETEKDNNRKVNMPTASSIIWASKK